MKIIEVIPTLSLCGGAESFVSTLSNELAIQGHECTIVHLFDVSESTFREVGLGDLVEKKSLHKKDGFDFFCLVRLLKLIIKIKPDIVHAHVGAIPYLILSVLFYHRCKYFATIHSEARREAGTKGMKFVRKLLFKFNFVKAITISESSQESFTDFYKHSSFLVYNGVSPYKNVVNRTYDKEDFLFVHVSRCHPVKNQIMLLEAFSEIIKDFPTVRLEWYGSCEEYSSLFQSYKKYLNSNIVYKGTTNKTRDVMAKADALCLTSTMEGMPMTIIEAMSVGCIPISTPVGGCVNMIDNLNNGILSQDTTKESYVEALRNFMKLCSEKRKLMSDNAIKSYNEKYSITKSANNYIKLFMQ